MSLRESPRVSTSLHESPRVSTRLHESPWASTESPRVSTSNIMCRHRCLTIHERISIDNYSLLTWNDPPLVIRIFFVLNMTSVSWIITRPPEKRTSHITDGTEVDHTKRWTTLRWTTQSDTNIYVHVHVGIALIVYDIHLQWFHWWLSYSTCTMLMSYVYSFP